MKYLGIEIKYYLIPKGDSANKICKMNNRSGKSQIKHSDKLCSSFIFLILTGLYWVKIHIKPIRVKQTDEKYSMKQNGIL